MKNNIAYYSYLTPNSSNQIVVDDVKYHGLNLIPQILTCTNYAFLQPDCFPA